MTNKIFKKIGALLFCSLFVFSTSNVFSAEAEKGVYETPGEILASKVVSKKLLRGPNHKIVEQVVTYNGFTNHFIIHTDFGRFKAVGNGMVPIRIQEINAIAKLDEIKKTIV